MDIDRSVTQYTPDAESRVKFCLDTLEAADGFKKDVEWQTFVVNNLTIEEIIGALVSAGQYIERTEEEKREEMGDI